MNILVKMFAFELKCVYIITEPRGSSVEMQQGLWMRLQFKFYNWNLPPPRYLTPVD